MKKFLRRKNRRSLGLLLGLLLSFSMGMTTFAAEPTNSSSFDVDVNTSSEVESSSSALSLTAPSGRILSERAVSVNGSQMYEVTFATKSGSDTVILPRSVYGYAAYDTHSVSGSFTVYAPGSSATTGGATLKASGFPAGTKIAMSVQRPDGTYAISGVTLNGNTEIAKSFLNSQPGNYTITFHVYGTGNGQLHCWIY